MNPAPPPTAPVDASGSVQYLVPLPVTGPLDRPSSVEPVVRTLAGARPVRWDYLAEPALGVAQTGLLLAEQPSPWDLAVAAEVSERMGGFVLVTESSEHTPAGGTALLYTGRLLRAWRRDATGRVRVRAGVSDVPEDAATDSAALAELVTGRTPGTLHRSWALASGEASGGRRAETATAPVELPPARASLTQIVLACDEDRWRAARRGSRVPEDDGWRWRPDRTPEADVPFLMVRGPGPLRPEWVADLAGATGGYAAAAEVRSQQDGETRPSPWVWVAPGEDPRTGDAEDGVQAVEVWQDIATVLGSYAAALSWPGTDRGHPLTVPGRTA